MAEPQRCGAQFDLNIIVRARMTIRIEILEKEVTVLMESVGRHERSTVMCAAGKPGPSGKPGKDGIPGTDGAPGPRGKDARDILEEQEEKCVICPVGEMGPIGPPGERGKEGEKGDKGPPGIPSTDGADGDVGAEGDEGPQGFPGRPGGRGPNGRSAEGGVGQPGPKGANGPVGRAGAQGPRGKRNYIYGPPGPVGQPGSSGLDGMNGNVGERGAKGAPGEKGADAKFCPCPMELQILNEQKVFLQFYKVALCDVPPHFADNTLSITPNIRHTKLMKKSSPQISRPSTVPSALQNLKNTQLNDGVLEIAHEGMSGSLNGLEKQTLLVHQPSHDQIGASIRSAPPAHSNIGPPANKRSDSVFADVEENSQMTQPRVSTHLTSSSERPPFGIPDDTIDIPNSFGSNTPSEQTLVNKLDDVNDYDETTTVQMTSRRRYIYVTKKPRSNN
ncbi:collagen triple helix repeat protein [Dictyocaulus viviparus]|uniref:Collagen triple helix repeat protein n=1 Tax=Dictyocaulus viviparus TaxID=29172 RepID=A0A0D8XPD8_DICVI|nr:collagen triple helix repeat protein [Dictyocaulus viviparus]